MAVGVVDSGPSILRRGTEPTTGLTLDELLDTLEREVRESIDACPDVVALGVGIPSTIDRDRGVAVTSVNLPIVDVPIRDLIAERIDLPVFIDNDANTAALAEQRFGAGKGALNMVLLTVGTGIGGGLVLSGELYRGSTGAGVELGHMVIDENGPECPGNCPNNGCLEAFVSGTALGAAGALAAVDAPDSALGRARADGRGIDGRLVTEAAVAGDDTAIRVFGDVGSHLGVALASYANIFEPDVIVIGGGVIAAGDLLLEPARAEVRKRALPPMNETLVVAAELGPDAGMIGAAAMALEETA
jgi:glucokinase